MEGVATIGCDPLMTGSRQVGFRSETCRSPSEELKSQVRRDHFAIRFNVSKTSLGSFSFALARFSRR
jgi:hypothetical protein